MAKKAKNPKVGSDKSDKKHNFSNKGARGPNKLTEKQMFVSTLKSTKGNISKACEKLNISRETYYEWKKIDPEFKKECDNIPDYLGDYVVSKLFKLIDKGNVRAIIYYCQTQLKDRGFGNKVEVTGKDGAPLNGLSFAEERDLLATLPLEHQKIYRDVRKLLVAPVLNAQD